MALAVFVAPQTCPFLFSKQTLLPLLHREGKTPPPTRTLPSGQSHRAGKSFQDLPQIVSSVVSGRASRQLDNTADGYIRTSRVDCLRWFTFIYGSMGITVRNIGFVHPLRMVHSTFIGRHTNQVLFVYFVSVRWLCLLSKLVCLFMNTDNEQKVFRWIDMDA